MYLVLVDTNAAGVVNGKDRIKLRHGAVNDISAAGLKITTQDIEPSLEFHLLSGSITLAVRFILPQSDIPVSAVAKVTWFKQTINLEGRHFTMGLKFIEINPQDQSAISSFIIEHQK
jgi:c-di-GMP-binding flagellar brake protein YcgR